MRGNPRRGRTGRRLTAPLPLLAAFSTAAAGWTGAAMAWTTFEGAGEVVVQQVAGDYVIEMKCGRERKGRIYFSLARAGDLPFTAVQGVVLAIEQADGRVGRHAIDTINYGSYLSGTWLVSTPGMAEFRKGTAMAVVLNGETVVLRTDMTGTAAARDAIGKQCGF